MKSYHLSLGVGIDGLTLRDHAIPRPGPGQAVVKIRAVSLNARELYILRGHYPLPIKPDVIAVSDGAGEVVAAGPNVTRAKPGDRVMANLFPLWLDGPFAFELALQIGGSLDGMLTEYALLDEAALVPVPDYLSYEEAATLPCAALTAWNALMGGRRPIPGESVLIIGSGGVALFTLQFAKLAGLRAVVVTTRPGNTDQLKVLGADAVIDAKANPEWHTEVRAATGGRGADHVIESGSGQTMERSLKSVAVQGQVAFVGALGSQTTMIDARVLRGPMADLRFIAVGSRTQFTAMNRAITQAQLKPVIDRVFPFAETIAAFRYFESNQNFGKVVIRVNE
ncbi:MAG TPA: NAD(P)-dependent alcohol dehydrogenase [Magnetospirillaceae bacterium]|jgi:NADPH:quinone reductase-like Zn-dependent oxidoreductase